MQLLVSVSSRAEAEAALAGGADVIDAKDPRTGPLGAVTLETFRGIHAFVGGARTVSAALGDAMHEGAVEGLASRFCRAGAALVKIGFAGVTDGSRVAALIHAAIRGAREGAPAIARGPAARRSASDHDILEASGPGVVAAAYADAVGVGSIPIGAVIDAAAAAGARGILVDTAQKNGPGLRDLLTFRELGTWVREAHAAGLLVTLAGKLTVHDLRFASDAGADVVGVRGAACEGGRNGHVVAAKVQALRAQLAMPAASSRRMGV